jgi:hypothetical protein
MKGGVANMMLLYCGSYESGPKKDASPKEEALTSAPSNTPPRREHDRRNSKM